MSQASQQQITQHISFGLTPSPFGTLLPSVATFVYAEKVVCNKPVPRQEEPLQERKSKKHINGNFYE
jgi:hypothetical protein